MATTTEETGIVAVNPYETMDRLDDEQLMNVLDPTLAARMTAGARVDALVYFVPVGRGKPDIVGLSTTGAQILATQVGGFQTRTDYRVDDIDIEVEYVVDWTEDSKPIKARKTVPGVRVLVAVENTKAHTAFIGVCDQPLEMVLKAGNTQPDPHGFVKAFNKAERNAIRKHFAAYEDAVVEFAKRAKSAGKAYIVGDVTDDEIAAGTDARANIRRMDTVQAEPMGATGAESLGKYTTDRIEALVAAKVIPEGEAATRLKAINTDLREHVTRKYGVPRAMEAPKTAVPDLMLWIAGQLPPLPADPETFAQPAATPVTRLEPTPDPEPEPDLPADELPLETEAHLKANITADGLTLKMSKADIQQTIATAEENGPEGLVAARDRLRAMLPAPQPELGEAE